MSVEALPPPRRIVTAIDADGQSYVAEDGPSPAGFALPAVAFRSDNMWRTAAAPSPVAAADDIVSHRGVCPPQGGTVIRVIDFPPPSGTREEMAALAKGVFEQLYPDARHQPSERSPGMHETDTIDYAIVLSGEIWAILDRDETLMRAGDILIQRGTNHAWENRSDAVARMAFVLIDAAR
jgi:hypothetical protein